MVKVSSNNSGPVPAFIGCAPHHNKLSTCRQHKIGVRKNFVWVVVTVNTSFTSSQHLTCNYLHLGDHVNVCVSSILWLAAGLVKSCTRFFSKFLGRLTLRQETIRQILEQFFFDTDLKLFLVTWAADTQSTNVGQQLLAYICVTHTTTFCSTTVWRRWQDSADDDDVAAAVICLIARKRKHRCPKSVWVQSWITQR